MISYNNYHNQTSKIKINIAKHRKNQIAKHMINHIKNVASVNQ